MELVLGEVSALGVVIPVEERKFLVYGPSRPFHFSVKSQREVEIIRKRGQVRTGWNTSVVGKKQYTGL